MASNKIFKCSLCDYKSNRKFNVIRHQNVKHADIITNQKIETKNNKKEQTTNSEVVKKEETTNLDVVKKEETNNSEVIKKEETTNLEVVKREEFFCKKCNKKYLTKKHLINHEKKCIGIDKLTCPKCMFHFSCKEAKSRHLKRNILMDLKNINFQILQL